MAGFRLPNAGTQARELMGDIDHVVEILNPKNIGKLTFFDEALRRFRREGLPRGIKSVAMIVLRADDERWLISVGPRGGWRKIWNFGNGRD